MKNTVAALVLLSAFLNQKISADNFNPVFSFSVQNLLDDFLSSEENLQISPVAENAKQTTKTTNIITKEEIEKQGLLKVKDVLTQIPALDISSCGYFGGASSVFIRGTEANHTLITIDGIRLYDAISPKANFDIAFLTTDNIERLEIIKGPQSGLYGSDAIGGVINIVTKKGKGRPKLHTFFEAGSHDTFTENIITSGQIKNLSFSFAATNLNSQGISQAGEKYLNDEKDNFHQLGFNGRLDFEPSDNFSFTLTGRYINAKFSIDDAGGLGGDDPNRVNTKNHYVLGFSFEHKPKNWWKYNLKISRVKENRTDDDDPDNQTPTELLRSNYESRLNNYGLGNNFYFAKWLETTAGVEHSAEKGNYYYRSFGIWGPYIVNFENKKNSNTGYYLVNKLKIKEKFFAEIASRCDRHSVFENHFTYKYGLAFMPFGNFKLYSNYGSGFKAPSLFQLYSDYGNIDLKPEESIGFDLGINLYSKNVNFQIAFFENNIKNMIDYDFSISKYLNFAKVRTYGAESSLAVKPCDILTVKFAYTYLEAKNLQTGEPMVRRSKNKFNLNLNTETRKINLNFNVAHFTGRYDKTGFPAILVKLKNYTKLDLYCMYKISKNITLTGKIINLTDQTYELVAGYGTLRRSYYAGLKANF